MAMDIKRMNEDMDREDKAYQAALNLIENGNLESEDLCTLVNALAKRCMAEGYQKSGDALVDAWLTLSSEVD